MPYNPEKIYDICYKIVKGNEGGYVSQEKAEEIGDRGGETFMGIARNFFPKWEGWVKVDAYKYKYGDPSKLCKSGELINEVKSFFKENFWDRMMLDEVSKKSPIIAMEMFDAGVNMSWKTVGEFFQKTINMFNKDYNSNVQKYDEIAVDGYVGNNTLKAFDKAIELGYEDVIVTLLNAEQCVRYRELAEKNKWYENFMVGWIRHRGKDPFRIWEANCE